MKPYIPISRYVAALGRSSTTFQRVRRIQNNSKRSAFDPSHPSPAISGRILPYTGGVVATFGTSMTRISVPALTSRVHFDAVLQGIANVYEMDDFKSSWRVDLSACRRVPVALLSTLLGYQKAFAERDLNFAVTVHPEARIGYPGTPGFPLNKFMRVQKAFKLPYLRASRMEQSTNLLQFNEEDRIPFNKLG